MSARPQIGIDRLPRRMSNEPRESMNCKSCRKRKIKCNRLRPTCEACQVFQCPCIYDAVPKKRGPKTDVLEALLKRVDGLERRLKDEKKSSSPNEGSFGADAEKDSPEGTEAKSKRPQLDAPATIDESAVYSPEPQSEPSPHSVQADVLLDTYFTRCHGKPYHILDESSTRQRIQLNQIPSYLVHAIYAVSSRFAIHPGGYHAAVSSSEEYAKRSRAELDIDDPSMDTLQTLLLLEIAFKAAGKGKKAYMMLASGIGMAVALELHREIDIKIRVPLVERESRRRLFWTCYLMDRFTSTGSKRPCLISDKSIILKLPAWIPSPGGLSIDGEFFQNGSNLQYHSATGKKSQGSSGMLIDIVRILGITNRYLAAGGVKGDSHFPWHSLSNLSKIRQDLDVWASGTQDVFSSVDTLFGQPDSTTLVLSKLVYHLIHCLIYRPFLPIDLAELAGTGQHQSWQIEATNLCFLHANAIAELVELGKQSSSIEWPAFVGYCICTAGTVHVHGAHYKGSREGEVFSSSADFLSREIQQLSELRYAWASVQHQRDTLQTIYSCHTELVKALASNPMRYSPVFHLEDFFDRYSDLGLSFDGAHISLTDIVFDSATEQFQDHDAFAARPRLPSTNSGMNGEGSGVASAAAKRKVSQGSRKRHEALKLNHRSNSYNNGQNGPPSATIPENGTAMPPPSLSNAGISEANLQMLQQQQQQLAVLHSNNAGNSANQHQPPLTPYQPNPATMPTLSQTPFSPPYIYSSLNAVTQNEPYDPMFGMPVSYGYGNGMMMSGMSGMVGVNEGMTPGGRSNNESTGTNEGEKDPFLSLLEQLAENEHSRGGPSELDFFLSGGTG